MAHRTRSLLLSSDGKLELIDSANKVCSKFGYPLPNPNVECAAPDLSEESISKSFSTVHGLCSGIVRKFYEYCGVNKDFSLIDDGAKATLTQNAYESLYDYDSAKESIKTLSKSYSESTIRDGLFELMENRSFLPSTESQISFLGSLRSTSPLPETVFSENVIADLELLCDVHGSAKDKQTLSFIAQRPRFSFEYQKIFLTEEMLPRKNVFSKKFYSQNKVIEKFVDKEVSALLSYSEWQNSHRIKEITSEYTKLFYTFLRIYEEKKINQNSLDYDDLILKTLSMMRSPESMGPVLHHIGQTINHILVDEAQDLSIAQWGIVRHLIEAAVFLNQSPHRSFLVVSDPKQSIYGFQGASPSHLFQSKEFLKTWAGHHGKPFREVQLNISFRSVPKILLTVNSIFSSKNISMGVPFRNHISCARLAQLSGIVGINKCSYNNKDDKCDFHIQLAKNTIKKIIELVSSKNSWLYTKERKPSFGDIMILTPKRDCLFESIVKEADFCSVPISGIDRYDVFEQQISQDLIWIARWAMCHHNDWALAMAIKGAFLGCSEEALFWLSHDRGKSSIWKKLQSKIKTQERSTIDSEIRLIYEKLEYWSSISRTLSPYEFFIKVVSSDNSIKSFLKRLGPQSIEFVENFLTAAQEFENTSPAPSISKFVRHVEKTKRIVKKDVSHSNKDSVKLMTVHGAKGTQSPIVFLLDISGQQSTRENFLYSDNFFIIRPPEKSSSRTVKSLKDLNKKYTAEERARLLYVAITRAEEQFYAFVSQESKI
ncbi:DNA helicase [Candidatus Hydrogenosomobacter endosymbioticus]|uniref:DNA 3'-5' helicase n=2 Tax=Candidatus Hydrogenosomobacter endosymbioticus TaxID=2558174 RepID=A0ABN6L6R0_9PROT|nr:DNA helicase [Candidatus Hydrogenosomobacter endosymbioticus]